MAALLVGGLLFGASRCGASIEGACDDLVSAACGRVDDCAPFLMQTTFGDRAACVARLGPRCVATAGLDGAKLTGTAIQACADAFASVTCDEGPLAAPACRFVGEKPDGDACASHVQCESGWCKRDIDGESCGSCASLAAEGGDCFAVPCGPGLTCDSFNGSKCVKALQRGDSCGDLSCYPGFHGFFLGELDEGLRPDLNCNDTGTCGAYLGEGAACTGNGRCDYGQGLVCASSATCQRLVIAKVGQPCGPYQAACEGDSFCSSQGECVARAKNGESCMEDPLAPEGGCIAGLECVAGRCTAELPACK